MSDTHEQILEEIDAFLADLDMVEWDRWIAGEWFGDLPYVAIYGWIDRADAHEDFVVVLRFASGALTYYTSSAEYSDEIGEVLCDDSPTDHNECRRVEDVLDIDNVVELEGSR